jgi:hypothetical protein
MADARTKPLVDATESLIGHVLAAMIALASLVGGIAALAKGMPPVMGLTMLVVGGALVPLVWKSLHRSRAAWSFLVAIVTVLGIVTLFGAPKIRTVLGIDLGFAMIIPVIMIGCVVALAQVAREYRD